MARANNGDQFDYYNNHGFDPTTGYRIIGSANDLKQHENTNLVPMTSDDVGGGCSCGCCKNNRKSFISYTNYQHSSSANQFIISSKNMNKSLFCCADNRDHHFKRHHLNYRYLGLLLFLLVSCFCVYRILFVAHNHGPNHVRLHRNQLKLVSVFMRHGDRSPSDSLPAGDPHGGLQPLIWPNGHANLTDLGKFRQFKIGLELRHLYHHHLDFNSSHFLAFSSPVYRCQESLRETLHGLFNNEWSLEEGRRLAAEYMQKCPRASQRNNQNNNTVNTTDIAHWCSLVPAGSAWPNDWRNISLDIETFPMLNYEYLNNCKYRRQNPTPVDPDLRASKAVSGLGLEALAELEQVLVSRYNMRLNFTCLGLWSTISNEIRLMRSSEMLAAGRHYYDWINRKMPQYFGKDTELTMFDLYEQVAVYAYRDRIVDKANFIQLSPIISSLIQSQLVALSPNGSQSVITNGPLVPDERYRNKKMIFYSSHDSIMQLLMHRLMIINTEEERLSYKERFNKCQFKADHEKFLAGLQMIKYGASLVFELHEMEILTQVKGKEQDESKEDNNNNNHDDHDNDQPPPVSEAKFAHVQGRLYNTEDGRYRPVDYHRLQFGLICQRLFRQLHPGAKWDHFYDPRFKIDPSLSCPFGLFRNVTSGYLVDRPTLDGLCL